MNKSNSSNNSSPAQGGQAKANKQAKAKRSRGPKAQQKNPMVNKVAPIAKGVVVTSKPAQIDRSQPNGDVVIKHREFIRDLNGTVTAFGLTAFPINPGLPGTFPWLSSVASSYESYVFESLKFFYEPQVATTTGGYAMLSVDYDASDPAPTTKQQAADYMSSVRCQTWSSCIHTSEKKNLRKRSSYYVRRGALAANQDVKLYDVGNLYAIAAIQGVTTVIGELYVEYTVRLSTPQIGTVGVGEAIYGVFSGTVNTAPCATVTGILPATVVSTGTSTSVSTFTFQQPWEGYVTVVLAGTTLAGIAGSGTATSVEINDVYDATAVEAWALYSLVADMGQTFILTISNATISSCSVYFAQADI